LSFGIGYLAAALPEFMVTYPDVALDLSLSDRQVDLVADGFDIAIRIARLEDSSLLARRLCAVRLLLVASPGYLDAHGRPTHPRQLVDHNVLAYTGGDTPGLWRFNHALFGEEVVQPPVRMWTDNADILNPALLAGQGVAVQPEFLVWEQLSDGALEQVMPGWECPPLGLHLMTPPSSLRPLRVQAVIDHLAAALAKMPWAHV
jgi:DNA-binding transcriptional LysR family regulator